MNTRIPSKEFFFQDKTGRGITRTWTLSWLKVAMKGKKNYNGKAASTWSIDAEIGSVWENSECRITRIK